MSVRCPNPVCRVKNEEEAWHCNRCGCGLSVEPGNIEHDEDRLNFPTLVTMLLVFVVGLATLLGTLYGILPPGVDEVA